MKSERKHQRGTVFAEPEVSLQCVYVHTLKVALMRFWKGRSYFGALGKRSFIVKSNSVSWCYRAFYERDMVNDFILCGNITVCGQTMTCSSCSTYEMECKSLLFHLLKSWLWYLFFCCWFLFCFVFRKSMWRYTLLVEEIWWVFFDSNNWADITKLGSQIPI